MNDREANELVRAIEALWNYQMDSAGRAMWIQAMQQMASAHASEAVLRLSERQRERPTIADVRNMIAKLNADQASRDIRPQLDPGREGIPEWVHVWAWMRKHNDFRGLPQQSQWVHPTVTVDEYNDLRDRWQQEGAPKVGASFFQKVLA